MLSLPGGRWRFGRPYQSMMPHCPLELKERWRRANLDDRQNAEIFLTGQLFLFKSRKLEYEAEGKLGKEREKLQRQASLLHQDGSSRLAKLEKELDRAELQMNIQKPKEVTNDKTQAKSRKETISQKPKGNKDKHVDQDKTRTDRQARVETGTDSNQRESVKKAKLRPLPPVPNDNIGTEFQNESKNPTEKAKPTEKEKVNYAKTGGRKECDGENTTSNNEIMGDDLKKNIVKNCTKTKPRPLPPPPVMSTGTKFQRKLKNSCEKGKQNNSPVQPKITKLKDCDRPSCRPPPPEFSDDVKKAAELYDRAAALSDVTQFIMRESILCVGKEARHTGEEAKQLKAIADGMIKRYGEVCLDAAEQRHAELKRSGKI